MYGTEGVKHLISAIRKKDKEKRKEKKALERIYKIIIETKAQTYKCQQHQQLESAINYRSETQ